MKKTRKGLFIALLLIASLLISVPVQAFGAPNLNSASGWAREDITRAISLGLVPVALQSDYTQAATRAEFAALAVYLYETVTGIEITGRVNFADTTSVYVEKVAYLGIVEGIGNNMFAPDYPITREQAAVLLSRLATALNFEHIVHPANFADNSQISSWALAGVGLMQALEIMGGVGNNNFAPRSPYTREQSIISMLRLFLHIEYAMPEGIFAPRITIPSRELTTAELNEWIGNYHDRGGIHAFELELVELVNAERANHGLQPVSISPILMIASRFKAQSMHDIGYFDHTSPVYGRFDNISRILFNYPKVSMGENLAWGQRTPQAVMDGWMGSPGHRDNILNPLWTEMGAGFFNFYWAQKFGNGDTVDIPAPVGS